MQVRRDNNRDDLRRITPSRELWKGNRTCRRSYIGWLGLDEEAGVSGKC